MAATFLPKPKPVTASRAGGFQLIDTDLGPMYACPGDWIVTDAAETRTIVRDRDFGRLFEPADEQARALMAEGKR